MGEAFETELTRAWSRTDWLFGLVGRDRWHLQGIELRHPLLFYVGHLPSFAWNHLSSALELGPFREDFDTLFARGIDPADRTEAAKLVPPSWPDVEEVLAYRDQIREAVLAGVPDVKRRAAADPTCRDVLPLVLEHELMHHETLLYMIQQLEPAVLLRPSDWHGAELGAAVGPRASVSVAAGPVRLGAERSEIAFGWDNEFPSEVVQVGAFELDRTPVTVADFAEFVDGGGYAEARWWRPQDWAWREADDVSAPCNWRGAGADREVRGLFSWYPAGEVGGWPARVSFAEATAYAAWVGRRLPTEAELHRAAFTTPDGGERPYPWGHDPVGSEHGALDFQAHGPVPVGSRLAARSAWGADELVGNGWEWTSTPFLPRAGFAPIHPNYPGYSADFFDGEHFVVFGGSWATDRRLVRRSFRNWYQARYPYVFSAFRTAVSA